MKTIGNIQDDITIKYYVNTTMISRMMPTSSDDEARTYTGGIYLGNSFEVLSLWVHFPPHHVHTTMQILFGWTRYGSKAAENGCWCLIHVPVVRDYAPSWAPFLCSVERALKNAFLSAYNDFLRE